MEIIWRMGVWALFIAINLLRILQASQDVPVLLGVKLT
jgi:hypothetical protein